MKTITLFWLVTITLCIAVAVLALRTPEQAVRWLLFFFLFIGMVSLFAARTVNRSRQSSAERETREQNFVKAISIQPRSAPVHSPARRSDSGSTVSPAYDPAYPINSFELSPTLVSLFDSPSSPCDTSVSSNSSSYDSSSSSDSSCSSDSSSGGEY